MLDWDEVLGAVGSAQSGDREAARAQLNDLWQRTDQPAQRCVLAHFLADVQDSLDSEVAWDEEAWLAFGDVRDADLEPIGVPAAAGFAPSLHLNLADGYVRQGRAEAAAREIDLAKGALHTLGDDGYGDLVRRAVRGVEERLALRQGL